MKNVYHLKYYHDSGHGWVAVKQKDLAALGITHRISQFSYHRGNTVYCEEDCDASILIDALKARGYKIHITDVYHSGRSFIRSYPPYKFNTYIIDKERRAEFLENTGEIRLYYNHECTEVYQPLDVDYMEAKDKFFPANLFKFNGHYIQSPTEIQGVLS